MCGALDRSAVHSIEATPSALPALFSRLASHAQPGSALAVMSGVHTCWRLARTSGGVVVTFVLVTVVVGAGLCLFDVHADHDDGASLDLCLRLLGVAATPTAFVGMVIVGIAAILQLATPPTASSSVLLPPPKHASPR